MEDRESLPWISNAFYNFGGSLFKSGRQEEAVQPLRQAVVSYQFWLDSGPTRDISYSALAPKQLLNFDRKEARGDDYEARIMLANRYEVPGVCYLALKKLEQATRSFESGLAALPPAEFHHIDTTAARDVRSCQLPAAKLLNRRTRTILMQEGLCFVSATVVSSVAEKLTQPGVPIVVQGIIQEYECTLLSTLSVRTNQIKFRHNEQMEIMMRLASKIYRGGRALMNPVRRARVLINIATTYQSENDQKNRDEAIHLVGEAIELLKENDLKGDRDLERYRNHYLALAYTWHGILDQTRSSDQKNRKLKPFQIALQLWESILSSVDCFVSWESAAPAGRQSRKEKASHLIPDPEQLFGHLQMLADCLAVIGDRVTQVQIYRLMLRLCNGVMPVDRATGEGKKWLGYRFILLPFEASRRLRLLTMFPNSRRSPDLCEHESGVLGSRIFWESQGSLESRKHHSQGAVDLG
jgi:tetratricopeptide (TPR) repeat protein